MTCHVAIAGPAGAVLFADSQGSTDRSEIHGLQKVYAGTDFVVGGAGSTLLLRELLGQLADTPGLQAKDLADELHKFLDGVSESARENFALIALLPDPPGVTTFYPGVFSRFLRQQTFGCIGSGSEFVIAATQRDHVTGVRQSDAPTLADTFVEVADLARAADESLTVNDTYMAGILANGRGYLLGDPKIVPRHVPDVIAEIWPRLSSRFQLMQATASTIQSEISTALQVLTPELRKGTHNPAIDAALASARHSIAKNRALLDQMISEYMSVYDAALARTA